MEIYWGEVASGFLYVMIGIRMCWLSVRTRELPERLLTLSFLGWGGGYLIYYTPHGLGFESIPDTFAALSAIFDDLGTIGCAAFTLAVFRFDAKWAPWFIGAAAVCITCGLSGSIWTGDVSVEAPLTNPFYWLDWVGYVGIFTWFSIESFLAYSSSQRRRLLGMCGPMVCNRYLLMGLAGAFWIAVALLATADAVVYGLTGTWIMALDYLIAGCEFLAIAMFWFAFIPPTFYRNWIESDSRAEEVAAR